MFYTNNIDNIKIRIGGFSLIALMGILMDFRENSRKFNLVKLSIMKKYILKMCMSLMCKQLFYYSFVFGNSKVEIIYTLIFAQMRKNHFGCLYGIS